MGRIVVALAKVCAPLNATLAYGSVEALETVIGTTVYSSKLELK